MASSDDFKYSPGKSRVVHYETAYDGKPQEHCALHFHEIEGHIERHIGAVKVVYHDLNPGHVPVDIMVVPATPDRRFHYLVTAGMSDMPMQLPSHIKNQHSYRYAELAIALPKYWPIYDEVAMTGKRWGYPVEHLKFLASIPSRFKSWLSIGHSVPNGEPVEAIGPDCDMTGFVLDYPVIGGEGFEQLKTRNGKKINFYAVYPVHDVEMEHKLKKGYASLRKHFSNHKVMEIFDPKREVTVSNSWSQLLRW